MVAMARLLPWLLSAALAISALPARAQDEGEPLPDSDHPGSDSPEAVTAAHARSALGRRRAQAFLIPLDEKARGATGRVAAAIERVMAGSKQYDVVDLAKALASDAEPAQEAKASEGRKLLAEARRLFENRSYIEAVPKFKAALKALNAGLAGVEAPEIAGATLHLATAQHLAGDQKGARESFLAAALLDPLQKLVAKTVDPSAEGPLKLARADLESVTIGALEVQTKPGGARVMIDGQPHGIAPVRLELTGGKHLVRLERTGFYPQAELVEVTSRRETQYSITLQATPGASQVNSLIGGAAEEASRGKAGERCARLAERFHLERVLIGSVSSHGLKISVLLALADPIKRVLIGKEDLLMTADGTDSDQVEADVQMSARKLIAADDDQTAEAGVAAPAPGTASAARTPAIPAPAYDGMVGKKEAPAAAPAPEGARTPVMPGARPPEPPADDTGLVGKDRRVAVPKDDAPASPASPAAAEAADAPKPERPAGEPERTETKAKKKDKGIKGKSGTEQWGDGG